MNCRAQLFALLVVSLLLALRGSVHAQKLDLKRMSFSESKGRLVVDTTLPGLLSQDAYDNLSSGFPTTVVLRTYVYRKKQELPIAIEVVSIRVIYDLWDEAYLLRMDSKSGRKNLRFTSRVEVLRALTKLRKFSVADLDRIRIGPHYFLALVAELNPVEEERLAEMRRWLTKSTSESHLDSSSSFFGSFVSVFVNPKLQKAERIVRLRSQPFYRVKR